MPSISGFALAILIFVGANAARAAAPVNFRQLDTAMRQLNRAGLFDGAVVVHTDIGAIFARGYGLADPFTGRRFKPHTFIDSASLAKPVTAASVLLLAQRKLIDLDAPVRRYLPEYPHAQTTVRHLLSHSAGLADATEPLGKTNRQILADAGVALPPPFPPGTAFSYCNSCYDTLAELIERVSGTSYLLFARAYASLPPSVVVRPPSLQAWSGRAIGFRQLPEGGYKRADSYDNELFYGSSNLSWSADALAFWGTQWWGKQLTPIRRIATGSALIGRARSGLTLGNWYCAANKRRCHYLGHHQGFHHMLYWDADRRVSIAMVSNNSLAPDLQQPLQRALLAFVEGRPGAAKRELTRRIKGSPVEPGTYRLASREAVTISQGMGQAITVKRGGITYTAFSVGSDIHYVPGLDVYIAASGRRVMRWLSLYEDVVTRAAD